MSPRLIFVTGGSGFVGSHIILQLLERGYRVKAPIRPGRSTALEAAFPSALNNGTLELVEIEDIATVDFVPLLKDVHAVIHVAAPLVGNHKSNEDVFYSAIEGSSGILKAAIKVGIKKFVYTSSIAALIDPDFAKLFASATIDENAWGTVTTEQVNIETDDPQYLYLVGKSLAEKQVWEIADQYPDVDVTTLVPPLIYGPYPPNFPVPKGFGVSNAIIYQLITGGSKGPNTYPDYATGYWVDVRDVAKAHVLALEAPPLGDKKHKRLLVFPEKFTWKEATLFLEEKKPELKNRLPSDEVVRNDPGLSVAPVDTSLTERAIGLKKEDYIPWQTMLMDTINMFLRNE